MGDCWTREACPALAATARGLLGRLHGRPARIHQACSPDSSQVASCCSRSCSTRACACQVPLCRVACLVSLRCLSCANRALTGASDNWLLQVAAVRCGCSLSIPPNIPCHAAGDLSPMQPPSASTPRRASQAILRRRPDLRSPEKSLRATQENADPSKDAPGAACERGEAERVVLGENERFAWRQSAGIRTGLMDYSSCSSSA